MYVGLRAFGPPAALDSALAAGAARLGLCAGSRVVCLADPTRGATSSLWATQGWRGEQRGSSTLCAPRCRHPGVAGTTPALWAPCQVFSSWGRWPLSPEARWGGWRLPARLKAGPSGDCPRRASPRPTLAPRIDVVWSCSPGPSLSRARRGTGVPSERVRSSRSVRGGPSLVFPPLPIREGEEGRGWVCGLRP